MQESPPESHRNCSIGEKRKANLEKDVAMDKEDLNLKVRVFLEVQLRQLVCADHTGLSYM